MPPDARKSLARRVEALRDPDLLPALRKRAALILPGSRRGPGLRGGPGSALEASFSDEGQPDSVADAIYRTLLGRPATDAELAVVRQRVIAGLDFDRLAAELEGSPEGVNRSVARHQDALRQKLRGQFAETGGSAPSTRLVFLHIMKVGGTSLSEQFHHWVGADRSRVHFFVDDLVLTPPPILAQLQFIAGHIPYEALSVIPGNYSTMCVLRDPYARTLSHFSHLRAVEERFRHLTLKQFVFSEQFHSVAGDYQARQLALKMGSPQGWLAYSPESRLEALDGDPLSPYPLQALFDSTPITLSDDELLESASANLAQIDYVGVNDQLDRIGVTVAKLFGATPEAIPRLNISPPIPPAEIDTAIRHQIDERTQVDRQLYEQAVTRQRALDEQG